MIKEETEVLELIKSKITKHKASEVVPTLSGTTTYYERALKKEAKRNKSKA